MSTITKEWLQQTISEYEANRDELPFGLDTNSAIELQAFKLALASLEAEEFILYRERNPYNGLTTGWQELTEDEYEFIKDNAGENAEFRTVYTVPPAPVSVPDELTREEYKRRFMEQEGFDDTYRGGWSACRAAMLQGAENSESPTTMQTAPALDSSSKIAESPSGNSPVIPDGWVACSERMPEGMQTVITSNGFDIGQAWWDGEGWNSFDSHDVVPGEVTHWMPLPAAPLQEVK
ncbi:DUF551 domain-containing protein [Enterobacter sp. J706]|uniref:DUF551 domain-containing protein n=1 Tax=Enterobacter sp. J706 TaxID=3444321 RepID=UPI003EB9AD8F